MTTSYVYGAVEAVAYEDGVRVVVHIDQAWDADDPIVKKRPDLFREDPLEPRGTIEDATRRPGAKSRARRS